MRLSTVGTTILRLCFPPRCVGCRTRLPAHARFEMVCDRCFSEIPRGRWLRCPVCRARLPSITRRCHPEARFVLAAASDFRNHTVRELIHALKYQPAHRAALPLGTLLAEYIAGLDTTLPPGALPLIPVPLHPRRERERGWNQAAVLARTLAELCPGRFEVRGDLLRRVRYTEPQVSVHDRVRRAANISGSFALANDPSRAVSREVEPPVAVLLDDVSTTGATMGEAARALKRAGVRTVIGLVVAAA